MLDKFRETAITWDKATRRIYSPVTANESDENGRKLVVQIVNGGQVEDLIGATLHLYWETRDKLHDGLDVFKAVDLKKGEFELSYTTGMLSNKGVLNANLVLIDTVGRVVSERFKITVTEGIDNDAIQSENSFSSLTQALIDISNLEQNYAPRLNNLTAQLQQKATKNPLIISLDELGVKKDGVTDDAAIIKFAISQLNALGGGTIIGSNGTYAIGSQLVLDYNTTLDLNGAVLKPIGTLNIADASFVRVRYAGNVVKNIIFTTTTAQYGVEFGSTSSNNLEMGCKATSGYNNLVRTESENPKPFLNRSLSLEGISRGRIPNKKVKKVEFTVSLTASQYLSSIKLRNFPSMCDITRLKVTDINGSPDYSLEMLSRASGAAQYFYTRGRASEDIDVTNLYDYYKIDLDDVLQIGIYNRKASDTAFKVEIWFENEKYSYMNKVWQYQSKADFIRPHIDSLAPNNVNVTLDTIQQVEYRFKNDLGTVHKLGVTPTRKTDLLTQYPKIILPTPSGTTQNIEDSSEIKFYLNYSASQAVVEKPTRLVFNVHKVPKEIKARLIVGWYSQAPDGRIGYLNSTSITEKDITIPATVTDESPFVINIPLDPKGYQKGSTIEGNQSLDFLYFVLWQKDSTYTPYLFGEEYVFSTYIQKEQGL